MSYDLVIRNGTVVTASDTFMADVAIQGEQIAAIGHRLTGRREMDAAGKYVIPGGVDIHVHLQMPLPTGFVSADTFFSGTRAAALGGTTTIVDFAATVPGQSLLEAVTARRAEADPQVVIDYGLHMTIGPEDLGRLEELPVVVAAGAATFKLYMAYGFYLDDGQLLQALAAIKVAQGRPVVHAENWPVICQLVAANLAAGRIEPAWHPRSRPALLEAEAVGRIIDLATYVGLPVHIFHVSCAPAAARIAAARAQGRPVTGETGPQYLFLDESAYELPGVAGRLPVCAPPLRTADDRALLWQALALNQLQLVATDHCPFSRADKSQGVDFSQIPGGVPSIEMRLAAIFSHGVLGGRFSLNRWVDLCCTTPAKLAGLGRKGHIAPGFDADVVLFDPQARRRLSVVGLHEQVDWTPYEGMEVTGWPVTTMVRGQPLVVDGEFVGARGQGQFVPRRFAP